MSRYDARSPEALVWRKLYATKRWKQTRADQLRRHPLCQACERAGRTTAATVCNHADPKSKATTEGFFRGAFTSLCAECHDAGEQKAEAAGYSAAAGLDGWPTDRLHPSNRRR